MTQQQAQSTTAQMNPTQLLQAQYDTLAAMYADQVEQNRRLVAALENVEDVLYNHLTPIKIEDVNMPFMAMVGLMLKVAFASIPAALIFGLLFACGWSLLVAGGLAALR